MCLLLAVFSTQKRRVTLTRVPMLGLRVTCARGIALTRVEVAHVVAGVAHVPGLTLTHVVVPTLVARGVIGTRVRFSTRGQTSASGRNSMLQLWTQVRFGISSNSHILK